MTNGQTPNSKKYKNDIHKRAYNFAIAVIKFTRKLPNTIEVDILKRQVIRSATSIAANLQEADGAKTRQEFRHSVSISKKEAKETKLWLRMICELYPITKNEAVLLINECEEIIKILATIVIKTES